MNATMEQSVNTTKTRGRTETKVVEVPKDLEQDIISQYQCFGWNLKNNQEVNVTSVSGGSYSHGRTVITSSTKTYIKLTFERHTGMTNFDILNEKFQEYLTTFEEVLNLFRKINNSNFSAITGLIFGGGYALLNVLGSIGSIFLIPVIFISLGVGLALFLITGILGGLIKKALTKKKLTPKINELCLKMDNLADEATQYLE